MLLGFIFFMFMAADKIYLSINEAKYAIQDKEHLEALAFAILIKINFNSSAIKYSNIRYCKELFHIGTTKMVRILKNGIEYGYLKKIDNTIVACKIKRYNEFNIIINRSKTYKENKQIVYKISDIIDLIRKSVLINHINKQNKCSDNFKRQASSKGRSKARNKAARLCRTDKAYNGLSNKRIMDITNTKLYRARKLIHSIVDDKIVIKKEKDIKTTIDPKFYNRIITNEWFRETKHYGYLFGYKGAIYCHVSNEYVLAKNMIKYCVPKNEY